MWGGGGGGGGGLAKTRGTWEQQFMHFAFRTQELRESRGGRLWLSVPNKHDGFCPDVKQH